MTSADDRAHPQGADSTPTVTVGLRTSKEVRAVIEEALSPAVKLVFLKETAETERGAPPDTEVLISWNPWRELGESGVAELRQLRLIQLVSAGADHVRFGELPQDVIVASNPGAYAEAMAEHVVGMALALAKRLPPRHAQMARGEFDQRSRSRMLKGATCAILGFGGIGRATARLFRPFGARVAALNSSGQTDEELEFIGTLRDLDEVLQTADVVVIALPLTRETRGLIGTRELELMKSDAILVNVARGAIVQEEALYRHLQGHPEFMAGIDAWWDEPHDGEPFRTNFPFFELPNVLGSPHNSALVPGFEVAAIKRAVDNVQRFLRGEPIRGVVRREDYPV